VYHVVICTGNIASTDDIVSVIDAGTRTSPVKPGVRLKGVAV